MVYIGSYVAFVVASLYLCYTSFLIGCIGLYAVFWGGATRFHEALSEINVSGLGLQGAYKMV